MQLEKATGALLLVSDSSNQMPHLTVIEFFQLIFIADYNKCVDKTWFIRPIVACIPAYMRFAQCLRRYRDTKETFPHLVNAMKYTTTFFVVIFSTLYIAFPG